LQKHDRIVVSAKPKIAVSKKVERLLIAGIRTVQSLELSSGLFEFSLLVECQR